MLPITEIHLTAKEAEHLHHIVNDIADDLEQRADGDDGFDADLWRSHAKLKGVAGCLRGAPVYIPEDGDSRRPD